MATDVRAHTVPAATDHPSRAALLALSLSTRDPIPVANTTARAALIVSLASAGITPTTANPVFVFRADAGAGFELEVTTDGTNWTTHAAGDTGWITTGLSWGIGWAAASAQANWQSFAYRVFRGKEVWVNGVVTRTGTFTPPSTVVTLPVGVRPSSVYVGESLDLQWDIQPNGGIRARAGSAAQVYGLDVRFILG